MDKLLASQRRRPGDRDRISAPRLGRENAALCWGVCRLGKQPSLWLLLSFAAWLQRGKPAGKFSERTGGCVATAYRALGAGPQPNRHPDEPDLHPRRLAERAALGGVQPILAVRVEQLCVAERLPTNLRRRRVGPMGAGRGQQCDPW